MLAYRAKQNPDGSYTIVLIDNGEIISGVVNTVPKNFLTLTNEELEEYQKIWKDEILKVGSSTTLEILEKKTTYKTAKDNPLLQEDNGKFYRLNPTVSLPLTLVQEYSKAIKDSEKCKALDNLWYNICQNKPYIREMIYDWLQNHQWRVTSHGLIEVYRYVTKIEKKHLDEYFSSLNISVKINTAIQEKYEQVKRNKKSPKNVFVGIKGDEVSFTKDSSLYSLDLETAYKNIFNPVVKGYTHNTHYKPRLFYIPGKETTLSRELCDESENTCSTGIHAFSNKFAESYTGYGETLICCLVNPAFIVSCPTGDYGKLRTCALYVVKEVEKEEEGTIIELPLEELEKASEIYSKKCEIDLENFILNNYEDINPKYIGVSDVINSRDIIAI